MTATNSALFGMPFELGALFLAIFLAASRTSSVGTSGISSGSTQTVDRFDSLGTYGKRMLVIFCSNSRLMIGGEDSPLIHNMADDIVSCNSTSNICLSSFLNVQPATAVY